MGTHRFDSVADAIGAGYVSVRAGQELAHYRGYAIVGSDTSGRRWFGYRFGVRAHPSDDLIRSGARSLGPFGSTVTVWTQDRNQLGRPGSFRVMFAPGALDQAIAEAQSSIDAALNGHHDGPTTE